MKLEELASLEATFARRGYRVRFRTRADERPNGRGEPEPEWEYLPDLADDGAPEEAAAVEWATRLRQVARWHAFSDIEVVGPDLEPLSDTTSQQERLEVGDTAQVQPPAATTPAAPRRFGRFGQTSANPFRQGDTTPGEDAAAAANARIAEVAAKGAVLPSDARPVIAGIPAQGGTVLLDQEGQCLVGDASAQVYVCPREAVLGKPGISWKPKVKRFEHVVMGVGTDGRGAGAGIPWLNWATADGALSVRAAYHSPTGVWFVRRG